MSDNSTLPVAIGTETFANKDIGGVKFPKSILHDSTGTEILGTTADVVVAAGAGGTIGQKLRAISRDLVANIVLAAGGNLIGLVKLTDGVNGTVTVKPASTAAVATDISFVGQLHPSSPGLITTGGQNTPSSQYVAVNGGGPGSSASGVPALVQPGTGIAVLGSFSLAGKSGTMAAGLSANSPIFALRYSGAGVLLVRKLLISVANAGTAFAAGNASFDLFAARAFSANDTGGAAATLTTNNGKLRTSDATIGTVDFRMSATATLSAGTRTLDATALASIAAGVQATAGIGIVNPNTILLEQKVGERPFILAPNEGFVLQATVPATGTWQFTVVAYLDEVATF